MLLDLAHRVGTTASSSAWLAAAAVHGAASPSPYQPLPGKALAELSTRGFTIVPQWLPPPAAAAILADAVAVEGAAREAGVGTNSVRRDGQVRRAKHLALHPPPSLSGGSVGTRLMLSRVMHQLCDDLNRAPLQLPRLAPLESELGYVYYPIDGHYERHLDVPAAVAPQA